MPAPQNFGEGHRNGLWTQNGGRLLVYLALFAAMWLERKSSLLTRRVHKPLACHRQLFEDFNGLRPRVPPNHAANPICPSCPNHSALLSKGARGGFFCIPWFSTKRGASVGIFGFPFGAPFGELQPFSCGQLRAAQLGWEKLTAGTPQGRCSPLPWRGSSSAPTGRGPRVGRERVGPLQNQRKKETNLPPANMEVHRPL